MTGARELLEALTLPLAEKLVRLVPTASGEEMRKWARLHGWDAPVDEQVLAHQAALNLVLRGLISYQLDADALPVAIPAQFLTSHSNALLRALGIEPQLSSILDLLALQSDLVLRVPQIATLAEALQRASEDVIGDAYAAWIPQRARRAPGQFWTPWPIAQLMSQWAIQSPTDRVLDPAFGSGVLLLAAINRLIQRGASSETALQSVAGVEISPLVFLMGLTNLLLRYPSSVWLRLRWDDFLLPRGEPAAILREPTAAYTLDVRQMALPGMATTAPTTFSEKFDAIICNPPYTRHHRLPEAYKSTWATVAEQEFGVKLSRFSSLFAHFFIQASRMLAPDGRMAFITPATVFEAFYSNQIKAFVRRELRLRAIVSFDETFPVFEGVDTAACITLIEGPGAPPRDWVVHLQVHRWPGVEPILDAVEQEGEGDIDWGHRRRLRLSTLEPDRKWTVIGHNNHDDGRLVPLASLARIVRGIATGANAFFVLSDDEVKRWGVDPTNLRPVLTKTREAPGYAFTEDDFDRLGREGKKRWLLYLTGPVQPDTPEALYIRWGEAQHLHERSLVRTRPLWYTMEQRDPAPIYFTYLSRKRSRFIYNLAGVLALNVFLCIYPIPAIGRDEQMLKAFLAVLNSRMTKAALRQVGRTYGGDTIKIEPREMDRLPVLNPLRLTLSEQERLATLFDELCQAESREAEEAIRQAIQETITVTANIEESDERKRRG